MSESMTWEEACRILGIAPTASAREIHEQYLYKVQLLHPDGNSNKPAAIRKKAEEELKQVNEAHNVLSDAANSPFTNSPRIRVSSRKLRFKDLEFGEKRSATFEVSSVGGTFSKIWIDDNPAPWLKVTDIRSLTAELLPIEVQIEANGIGESSEHASCNLAIRLENSETGAKDEVVVIVELWMTAEPGTMRVLLPKPIRFKSVKPGDRREEKVEINNIGRGWLRGHLFITRPWISISPDTVNIPPTTRQTYTISLTAKGMRRDFTDRAFINILTNGGNERVGVDLIMASSPLKLITSYLMALFWVLLALVPPFAAIAFLPLEPWREPIFWWGAVAYVFLIAGFSQLGRIRVK